MRIEKNESYIHDTVLHDLLPEKPYPEALLLLLAKTGIRVEYVLEDAFNRQVVFSPFGIHSSGGPDRLNYLDSMSDVGLMEWYPFDKFSHDVTVYESCEAILFDVDEKTGYETFHILRMSDGMCKEDKIMAHSWMEQCVKTCDSVNQILPYIEKVGLEDTVITGYSFCHGHDFDSHAIPKTLEFRAVDYIMHQKESESQILDFCGQIKRLKN